MVVKKILATIFLLMLVLCNYQYSLNFNDTTKL